MFKHSVNVSLTQISVIQVTIVVATLTSIYTLFIVLDSGPLRIVILQFLCSLFPRILLLGPLYRFVSLAIEPSIYYLYTVSLSVRVQTIDDGYSVHILMIYDW